MLVDCASYGFQIWSHHNDMQGRFLKTSPIPFTDGLVLVTVGTIPLVVLELVKVVRNTRRGREIEERGEFTAGLKP